MGNNQKWFLIGVHSMNLQNLSNYNIYHDVLEHKHKYWIESIVYDYD